MAYISTHKQIHQYHIKKDTLFQAVMAGVSLFILAPILIYFYHTIPSVGFKIISGVIIFLFISNMVAKLIFSFIDHYDADNSIPGRGVLN